MSRGTSVRDPVGLDADSKRRRSAYHRELVLGARASRAVGALEDYGEVLGALPGWLQVALEGLRTACAEHSDRADLLGKHPAVSK